MNRLILAVVSILMTFPVVAQQVDEYSLKRTTERYVKKQPAPTGFVEQSVDKYMAPMGEKQKELAQKELPSVSKDSLDKQLKGLDQYLKNAKPDFKVAQAAYRDIIRDSVPKSVCRNGKLSPNAILAFRENLGLDMDRSSKIFIPDGHYDCDAYPCVFFVDSLKLAATGCNDFSFFADRDTFDAEDKGLRDRSQLNYRDGPWLVEQTCQMTQAGFTKKSDLVVSCKCQMKITDVDQRQYTYNSGDRFLLDSNLEGYRHREDSESYDIAYDFCTPTPDNQKTAAYKRSYQAQVPDVRQKIAQLQQKMDENTAQRREQRIQLELEFDKKVAAQQEKRKADEKKRKIEEAKEKAELEEFGRQLEKQNAFRSNLLSKGWSAIQGCRHSDLYSAPNYSMISPSAFRESLQNTCDIEQGIKDIDKVESFSMFVDPEYNSVYFKFVYKKSHEYGLIGGTSQRIAIWKCNNNETERLRKLPDNVSSYPSWHNPTVPVSISTGQCFHPTSYF